MYDVITIVILAAAVIFYFIVPAANDVVDVVQKAKQRPKDEEGPE